MKENGNAQATGYQNSYEDDEPNSEQVVIKMNGRQGNGHAAERPQTGKHKFTINSLFCWGKSKDDSGKSDKVSSSM